MTLCNPRVGDIWLAHVEFADHPGIGKVRPVVVVDVREDACVVLAAKVTSKDLRSDGSGSCIPILGWNECGLRKPSYVRLDQRLELAFEKLLRGSPIGHLPKPLLDVVISSLRDLGD